MIMDRDPDGAVGKQDAVRGKVNWKDPPCGRVVQELHGIKIRGIGRSIYLTAAAGVS
jgi:hypothetical protein